MSDKSKVGEKITRVEFVRAVRMPDASIAGSRTTWMAATPTTPASNPDTLVEMAPGGGVLIVGPKGRVVVPSSNVASIEMIDEVKADKA